jgi:(p)ppGpp synthase/HD superfamily hydrolase
MGKVITQKSDLTELARNKCVEWHGNQLRKYVNTPYYTHPFAVSEIVKRFTDSEDATTVLAELGGHEF